MEQARTAPLHDHAALNALGELLAQTPLLVVTGAGISVASGIPDYRDAEGMRRGSAPMMHQEFIGSASARRRYWARAMFGWRAVGSAQPNATHRALAALQQGGRLSGLITQNVDGLHQAAGSREVIELHGNLSRVVCLGCGETLAREAVQQVLETLNPALQDVRAVLAPDGDALLAAEHLGSFRPPPCPHCGSDLLKPDVVFFGDGVPAAQALAAWEAVQRASGLLVLGSSLMTFSSFRLCREIAQQGKPLIAVNLGKTRADELLSAKIELPCEEVLPWLANRLQVPLL